MKALRTGAAAALAAASLSACVIVDAEVERDWDDDRHGRLGLLYGAEVNVRAPEISIIVRSNGCTERDHFQTRVERAGRDRYSVAFRRLTEDHCKALLPEGRRLTWSYMELGLPPGAQVIVANPVGR